jgi:CBS domain-containing protein
MPTIRDVMSTDLVTVSPRASVAEAAAIMSAKHVGSAIVLDENDDVHDVLVGIFSERDILHALGSDFDAAAHTVAEWMTKEPATIDAGASVTDALGRMLKEGFRHLPVLEGGRLVGMVSLRDLSRGNAD